MKVFWIFLLLAVLNVGLIILLELIQAVPFYRTITALLLPFRLIGGQEYIFLALFAFWLIANHRNIVKNSKKTG